MPAVPQIPKIIHFTLDGDDYSLDVIDAAVVPTPGAVQSVTTLDGVVHQDIAATTWGVALTCVLDWDSTRPGLAYYLKANAGDEVAFVLNVYTGGTATGDADSPPIAGTCKLVPIPYGGTGNAYPTAQVVLPITGEPTLDITP